MTKMILVQWRDEGMDWTNSMREDLGYEIPALFYTRAEADAFINGMAGEFGGEHRQVQADVDVSGISNVPVVITSVSE